MSKIYREVFNFLVPNLLLKINDKELKEEEKFAITTVADMREKFENPRSMQTLAFLAGAGERKFSA